MHSFPKNKSRLDFLRIGVVPLPKEKGDFLEGPFLSLQNIHEFADLNLYLKIQEDSDKLSQKESGIMNYFDILRLKEFLDQVLYVIDDLYKNPKNISVNEEEIN